MTNPQLVAALKKHPISIGCGLLSLVLAVTIYFRGSVIPETEAELAQKSVEGERCDANIKNAKQLKEQLDALVAANQEINSRLVRAPQVGTNTQFFYKLEGETGVKLIDLRQSQLGAGAKVVGKNAFVPIGFTLAVQGQFPELLRLLRELESGARYCRILTASCGAAPADRSAPLSLTLNLEILGQP